MWKLFAFGGALVHTATGIWPVISACSENEAVSWLTIGMHSLGAALLGIVFTGLHALADEPPEVLPPAG